MNTLPNSRRGSGLLLVLVATIAVSMVLTSLLHFAVTEKRLNNRAFAVVEAQNAVEAVVESGFAQLMQRFDTFTQFPVDALHPTSGNPLIIPDYVYTHFEDAGDDSFTTLDLPTAPYNATLTWGSQPTELFGGVVPPGEWLFITDTPADEEDPEQGKMVFSRFVRVYGKATLADYAGNEFTAYASGDLWVRDVPLFAHAIFYNMDMEIAPGPRMDIYGSVHANGDMYIQSNSGLYFHKNVSAAGDIFHGPSDGHGKSTSGGEVSFVNRSNNLVSMKNGGSWLDSLMSDWREVSSTRWHGKVQDASHGVPIVNPVAVEDYSADDPDTGTVDDQLNYAYQLIQPAIAKTASNYSEEIEKQKFAYKAGLTVELTDAGTGAVEIYTYNRDVSGNVVYTASNEPEKILLDNPDNFVVVEPFSNSSGDVDSGMYDRRRGKALDLIEVDVGKLKTHIESNDATKWNGRAPSDFWNGVVYVKLPEQGVAPRSDGVRPSIDNWGVRLVNGSEIPSYGGDKGMTLATNNVLYVQGHYNADGSTATGSPTEPDDNDEPPAALVADAINILSNAWNNGTDTDRNSNNSNTNDRPAQNTEVAAAILTGLAPSDKNDNNRYSGGVENFPRFLENWSGDTLTYRGSMVSLFESEVATEPWGSSGVYNAPGRSWGFNRLFAEGNFPPGTPNARSFRRINYRQLNEAEWTAAVEDLEDELGL